MIEYENQETERRAKKRFLKRYKKTLELIDRLNLKLVNLDDRMLKIKSPGFSDMPRGGTPVTVEDLVAEKMEIEERIRRLKAKSKKLKIETLEKIDELDDTRYAEILESYFVDRKEFGTIAEDTGYTVRHIIRLYSEAINELSL